MIDINQWRPELHVFRRLVGDSGLTGGTSIFWNREPGGEISSSKEDYKISGSPGSQPGLCRLDQRPSGADCSAGTEFQAWPESGLYWDVDGSPAMISSQKEISV
ncbi:MAG: hypothetical protein LBP22_09420 [Deltaproteobacteria bacterium]|jgi:hypothetical protein|nr:hypothetical protein [Deltaproteobacteria bacterium]